MHDPPPGNAPGDLLDPATIADPYPFLAWARAHQPVLRIEHTPLYLVTTWDLVVDALTHVDDFSSNLNALVYTDDEGRPALFDMTPLGTNIQTLATADPPTHALHRKTVFPQLVERKMAALEEFAAGTARRLIADGARDGRLDVTANLANRLPMTVLCNVMGFGDADVDALIDYAFDGTELLAGTNSLADMARLSERAAEAGALLAGWLDQAKPDPDAGVIGAVARGVAEGVLTREEGVSTLVILLGAGGESTASLIGNCVRVLADDDVAEAALRDDRTQIEPFIEEVLRLESPFKGHFRTVRRPTVLGDVELAAGDTLLLMWSSANRDARHLDDPDELRLDREHPRDHLGFGRGIHHCVGAPLARREARVAIDALLDASTHLALDPEAPPRYVNSCFVRRHDSLAVTLH
jgi:cytochrome P450